MVLVSNEGKEYKMDIENFLQNIIFNLK
ncbi:hypothetical protein QIA27_05555 (plasmid) [Borreliella tanukii]